MKIQFATNSYKHPSLPISAQQCINAYAEREPKDAKDEVAVLDHPGLSVFATCGSGPIRGMRVLNGVLYVVSGTLLYSVSITGVVTVVGGAVSGVGPVSMSDNGQPGMQLIIVNGSVGYIFTLLSGFQPITDPNFFPANTVTFFDNYFVLDRIGTNQYYLSNLLDGTIYQGTNIASADGQPGNIVSMVNQTNTLFIFGESHMEAWYDAGNASFPFLRYDGATIERGCIGARSVVKEDNCVFFLGNDLIYYKIDNGKPVRVSTHAIELEWATYPVVSDINAFSYTYGGHKFVVLNFPTVSRTWVFDISTGLWHERVSWDQNNNSLGRWRVGSGIIAYNQQLFGDAFNGTIGVLNPNISTEYGNTVPITLVSPPIHSDRVRLFHDSLELDMETGVGTTTGQGQNPMVIMDFSNDSGRTYTSLGIQPSSMGAIGNYQTRVRWTRLGQSRTRVYRVRMTDPVRRRLIAAHSTIRKGAY